MTDTPDNEPLETTAPAPGTVLRLLPWTGEGGKASYLIGNSEGSSFLSHLADAVEDMQLEMAGDLLTHVQATVAERAPSEIEWRHLVTHLSGSMRDVIRVAESRGERLRIPAGQDEELARAAREFVDRTVTPLSMSADYPWERSR